VSDWNVCMAAANKGKLTFSKKTRVNSTLRNVHACYSNFYDSCNTSSV
jgi:hypothetical protein